MHLRLIVFIIFCVFILPSCSNKKIYKNSNSFQGIVIRGKQEARQLDIPTANISIVPYSIQEGVYSCRVLVKEKQYKAMCYYDLERSNILEAYIVSPPKLSKPYSQ